MAYDKQIQQILDEADDLPSLPGITQKVLQMSLSSDISLKAISNVISTDAALVMRFLKIVNSAYYGFANTINDIHQAVAILGADAIRNVVVTLSLIDVFPIKINEEYSGLFKRSLCSAVAGEFISQMGSGKERSDVFLAGMLQNLGMYILMHYLPSQYLKTISNSIKLNLTKYFLELTTILSDLRSGKGGGCRNLCY
jgi:HD-like signal output (HDOD) protein